MGALSEIWGYLKGEIGQGEGFSVPNVPRVPWIEASKENELAADYALEASIRSATDAAAGVKGLLDKAAALLTMTITLFPLAVAATLLVLPAGNRALILRWVGFGLFVSADLSLVRGAILCFLASGLILAGGSNPARFTKKTSGPLTLAELKAAEADAWYAATEIAFATGQQKARLVFKARRALVIALLLAVAAGVFSFVVRLDAANHPEPTPPTEIRIVP